MTQPTQKYLTRLETPSVMHAFPIATFDVSIVLIGNANECVPVENMAECPVPSLIATFAPLDAPVPPRATPATSCGTLCPSTEILTS
jgi:hypothetical protein